MGFITSRVNGLIWSGYLLECLFEIGFYIIDMLDAHAHPDLVRVHARIYLLGSGQLLMRGGGGMDDQGFGWLLQAIVTGKLG